MEREDHIKNLHDKLNSIPVIDDMDSLWNELEPRLPKKRKRRLLFILIPLLLMSSLIVFGLLNKNTSATQHTFENQVLETETKKEEKNEPQNSAEVTGAIPNQNVVAIDQQEVKSKHLSPETEGQLNKSSFTPVNNNSSIQIEKTSNQNSLLIFNQSNSYIDKQTKSTNAFQINSKDYNNGVVSDMIKYNTNHNIENKIKRHTVTEFLDFQELNKETISFLTITNSLLSKQPDFLFQKQSSKNTWAFNIGSYILADYNRRSMDIFSTYGQTINDLTSINTGYSYAVSASLSHRSGIHAGVGIEKVKTFEKFRVNNILTTSEMSVNNNAFTLNGEFISKEVEQTKTIRQDVLVHNTYNQTNILPFIGYQWTGKIHFTFSISPMFNLNRTYDGYLINKSDLLTTDINDLYQSSNFSYNGYEITAIASKRIWNKLELGIRTQLRQTNNLTSDTNVDFQTQLRSYSVGLDLKYPIN